MELIWFIIIGAVAGWLGGQIFKGSGMGLLGNIIVGVVGGIIGGWLAGKLGLSFGGLIGSLAIATGGAVLLLFIASLIKKG